MKAPLFPQFSYSGPTSCIAAPDVMESIRKDVREGHLVSSAEVRLAINMGILSVPVVSRTGFNDGVIYPPAEFHRSRGAHFQPSPGAISQVFLSKPEGDLKALVLLVDFEDNEGTTPVSHYQDLLFNQLNPNSMASFYNDLSYGKLNVTGEVIDWIRAPHPYSYYTNGASGTGSDGEKSTPGLVKDVLEAFCQRRSLSSFDLNGDGYLDGLFIIHAGKGAEAERDKMKRLNMIWSHKWTLRDVFENSGVRAFAYFTAPEDGKLGVFAHEFGHFLGLPDLYDTSYLSHGIGDWCLMAGGSWNGGGDQPARMSAWCLEELGWIKPKTIATSRSVSLAPLAEDPNDCVRLWINKNSQKEYLLIENRQQSGRDAMLPGHGLAVWHVDSTRADNTNTAAYKVALIQADGAKDLESLQNAGDAADLFPGDNRVRRLTDSRITGATTRANSGEKTGIALTKIKEQDGKVSFDATV